VIDRNGLRPSKYIITKDKRLLISSEYGVLKIPDEEIVERGKLNSGEMMGLDLKTGEILKNSDINDYIKTGVPYSKWLNEHMTYLQEHEFEGELDSVDNKEMESKLDEIADIRLLLITQPRLAKRERKKPELLEVKIGGGNSIKDRFEYAKNLLGKEIKASDVFQEGQWIDVIAVTKGKGFQGPVKRWGVAKLHHKSRKTVRGVGSIGPWTPSFVMRTVPRAGQMGFHRRTEYNKQVLKIGDDGVNITPKGGFVNYGEINGGYLILKGSVPGPKKRLITLRHAVRPPAPPQPLYKIEEINLESQQGK